ncbi:MAG: aconitate hydratase [Chloroflexi bacterium]|nr:aconitate hydratase [Chloroflexota bacterium]
MPAYSVAEQIVRSHLVSGEVTAGSEISLRVDQLLLNDGTAPVAFLQFEAMGLDASRVSPAVCYIDHNMVQVGFESADDQRFLQSFCARYGLYFSRPGNGIGHQVHLERFAAPGAVLLGADSHTPMAGAVASLAIGAGGLDVTVAMAGAPHYLPMPRLVGVRLLGHRQPWVSAKDVAFELLRRLSVRGGVGKILEYTGPGVATLSVPERGTIANMGTEVGATSSIFPSDEQTRRFLRWQGREATWHPLQADPDARYDDLIELDLGALEPLAAAPHAPDNVVPVRELEGLVVDQVCVGSCTNSSYHDLMTVARVLEGKTVAERVSLVVSPGSKQVLDMLARNGALASLIEAGARILESTCGPCNGYGQAPPSEGVSVRTHNRNFRGRSGTLNARVYLASPEVAAATALAGRIADPRRLGEPPAIRLPARARVDDRLIIPPGQESDRSAELRRGPNIAPIPNFAALPGEASGEVLLKLGDDVSTDDILPSGAAVAALKSNVAASGEHLFNRLDPTFPRRARAAGGGLVVGGQNYGQGSSRENAALVPRSAGVWGVVARSLARIHRANLVNFGILPLVFDNPADYDRIQQGERWRITDTHALVRSGSGELVHEATGAAIRVQCPLTGREREVVLAGGLLNYARSFAG